VEKFGSIRKASAALSVSRKVLSRLISGGASTSRIGAAEAKVERKGRSLSEFRASYDKSFIVPRKISAALKILGPSGWEYEVQFARIADVSLADLGNFRDQFSDHVVSLRESRRAWAGSKKTAKEMRAML
jgi:hypothetical protein